MDVGALPLDYLWLGATMALVAGLATVSYVLVQSPQTSPMWHGYLANLQLQLDRQAGKATALEIVAYQGLCCAALIGLWLGFGMTWAPVLCLAVIPLTTIILQATFSHRTEQLALQLDTWLLMLSNMLTATGSRKRRH